MTTTIDAAKSCRACDHLIPPGSPFPPTLANTIPIALPFPPDLHRFLFFKIFRSLIFNRGEIRGQNLIFGPLRYALRENPVETVQCE